MIRWANLGAFVLTLFWADSAFAPAACGTPNLPPPRIAISPSPVNITVLQGGSQSQGITISELQPTQSWVGTATSAGGWLSLSPTSSTVMTTLPFDGATLNANGSTLSPGTHTGSVTITPSACSATGSPTTVSVTLTVVAQPTIAVSAAGNVSLTAGGASQSVAITIARTNYTAPLTLSVTGLPAGVTASITQPGTGNSGSIAFTAAASAAAVSNAAITVQAAGTGVVGSTTLSLSVTAAAASSIAVAASLTSVAVNRGGSQNVMVSVTRTGFTGSVTLSVSGLPAGVTTSITQPGTGSTGTVTFQVASTAAAATATVTITASGSGVAPATASLQFSVVGAAFEPQLSRSLNAGFYILEATLASGAAPGFWGLEVIMSQGEAAGGFNLGGGVAPNGTLPAFAAFLVDATKTVNATINAQLSGGLVTLRFLDSQRRPIGNAVTGLPPQTLAQSLSPGFYIVEAYNSGAALGTYQLGLSADYFSGGINTGGQLAPGVVGFGAFFVPVTQNVQMRLYGTATYGSSGAGSMILTLKDANRNVVQVVSPP